jgi:GNAT superfamily N-acetyltransferase
MAIRVARLDDVEAMVDLADRKRQEYASHAPRFHRPAADAKQRHRPWLTSLVEKDDVCTLVSESGTRRVDGFVIASLVPAPPVYDPGGLTCLVDDFVVAEPALWRTVGLALLRAAEAWSRERGAVQAVVVCGPQDQAKRQMLLDAGAIVASEWFTAPLVAD